MLEDWVVALTASPMIYLVMYAFVAIDGFFPPIPSESVVIGLAALAMATGTPNLWLVIAVAAVGAFTGDQIAYAIGRRVHVRRSRLLRGARAQRTLDRAEQALATRGASFILGARYIPVGRVAVNMTAGAVGFPRRRFVGLTALAAVSWAFYSAAIGVGAGAWLHERPVVAVVVGVVGGTLIGLGVDAVLSRVHGHRRLRPLEVPPAPEASVVPAAAGPEAPPIDVALRDDVLVDVVLREDVVRDDVLLGGALLDVGFAGDSVTDGRTDGPVAVVGRAHRRPAAAALRPGTDHR